MAARWPRFSQNQEREIKNWEVGIVGREGLEMKVVESETL